MKEGWRQLWTLQIPPKVKACVWRICKGFTPTRVELRRRHMVEDTQCGICSLWSETSWHLFMDCSFAKKCCELVGLLYPLEDMAFEADSLVDWDLRLLVSLPGVLAEIFCMNLWGIWKERNARVWNAIAGTETQLFISNTIFVGAASDST